MSKRLLIVIFVVSLGIVFVMGMPYFPVSKQKPVVLSQSLRVSTVAEYSALVHFAKDKGFFDKNGLQVTTVEYDSGGPSFNAMLNDEVDIATGADFVGARNSFDHQDFKIIASMFGSDDVFELIARKDHGIQKASDLKGKKIGLSKKTMGEFFLGVFLTSNNLALRDILQVDGQPADLEQDIVKGNVDAIVTFHPHLDDIEKKLGENAVKFLTQDHQLLYTLLYAKSAFISRQPDTVQRFLLALVQAQQYMAEQPAEVRDFFKDRFHYDDIYIAKTLARAHFEITLSESMLLFLDDEARWIIENKLSTKNKIPNFLDMIYFDALAKVKPEAISVIR